MFPADSAQGFVWIDAAACRGCDVCPPREVCATKAIVMIDRGEPRYVEPSRCHACWLCLPACPFGAVRKG